MRRLKRVGSLMTSAILACSSLMTLGFTGIAHAASGSDTCTWTGATDNNFSTATNWSGCSSAAPVSGDNLVFDVSIITAGKATDYAWTLNNDITSLQVGGITFTGTSTGGYYYVLTGNSLAVGGNVTNNATGDETLGLDLTLAADTTFVSGSNGGGFNVGAEDGSNTLDTAGHAVGFTGSPTCGMFLESKLAGSGSLTTSLTSAGLRLDTGTTSYSGAVNVTSGVLGLSDPGALGSTSGVTVGSDGTLGVAFGQDTTYNFPLSLSGTGFSNHGYPQPTLYTTNYIGFCAGADATGSYTATFSGPVTLQSNATFSGTYNAKVTGTYTPNGHTFTVASGSVGTLTLPGSGAQSAPAQTDTYSDSQPTEDVTAGNNQTAVIDGTRQYVSADSGGTVKGTGTVKSLYVNDGGTVAPGHSPGTLTVLQTLTLAGGSTYQAELKDAAAGDYDQLVVGSASDTTGNDVTLGDTTSSPILSVSLYKGYSIKAGDSFTIINNLSKTDVKGTFKDLPEGATFKVSDGVFKITYKGGDGNDVVLSAVTAPTTPDTGFALVSANPAATLGVTVLAAGAILLTARRLRPAPARAKATTRHRR